MYIIIEDRFNKEQRTLLLKIRLTGSRRQRLRELQIVRPTFLVKQLQYIRIYKYIRLTAPSKHSTYACTDPGKAVDVRERKPSVVFSFPRLV